jgi:NADPH-dependent 2,4-dienoyl-CoA reductase/sulfur reductase-like enzyme/rhodanese-related sulfurtransferase
MVNYQTGFSEGMEKMKVLIVGGVAGGATAAARLRRLNEFCEIILFERGEHISYANCGLPYHIGGVIEDSGQLILQTPESFKARFNIDVRVKSEVVSINPASKTVEVKKVDTGETYSESYDYLIISTGAYPVLPSIKGADSERVFTLRSIADTFRIKDFIDRIKPRRAAVIGGGYIGVEVAENLHKAGLDVTIIEKANQVIASIDFDMAAQVHRHIEKMGVRLLLESTVHAITDGKGELRIAVDRDEITADMVVMAVGVLPDTALAKRAGLKLNQRGSIIVDRYMRTSVRDIYAVGDAVEVTDFITGQQTFIPLAGPANKQGRIAADNICGLKSEYTGTQGSSILKVFDLTVAATGINEKTAKKLGIDYDKSFTFSPSHASYYPGASTMTMKVLFEKRSGKILGAQIIGHEGVDKRCDVIATAIRFGATVHDLTKLELCYAPPYSSAKDPVNIAGYAIENILQGRVKHYHWHDVDSLPRDGSVTLLDTRTGSEYQKGHIDGFINIPLDRLREHLRELDKSKPVYVLCQIGLRGYIACRMLTQHGFDCYNLSGGYRLYQSIFGRSAVHQNEMINPETQLPKDLPDNGKNDK